MKTKKRKILILNISFIIIVIFLSFWIYKYFLIYSKAKKEHSKIYLKYQKNLKLKKENLNWEEKNNSPYMQDYLLRKEYQYLKPGENVIILYN